MISVLMPVYNAERYLAASIEAVLARRDADLELVIVDDGSTDSSPKSSNASRRSIRVSGT